MASRKQRNKRIYTALIIWSLLILAVFAYYGIKTWQTSSDPGYGQIDNIEIDNEDEGEDPMNNVDAEVKGDPLTCVTFKCGDALSVLIDIGETEVLYDTGYAKTAKKVSKKAGKYIDGELDYLIISHSHADHIGGAAQIAEDYDIGTVITSGETSGDSDQFDISMDALKEEGCRILDDSDMTFELESGAVLNIVENLDPGDTDNPNDLSVVADILYGSKEILLTGDSEKDAERGLIGKFSDVTLFVAGHHMSNTSNTQLLLLEWNPVYIFASCQGKGSEYGFPHKKALLRCLAVSSNVFGTFKSGDLIYTTDGNEDVINCESDQVLTEDDCPEFVE